MKSFFSLAIVSALGTIGIALVLTATACGSATPTRVPATSTLISVAQGSPTPAATPTFTPTSATTTTITATVPATLTKVAQFVTPTPAVRATATKGAAVPPAPGPLKGRIAYSVRFPGVDFVSREVRVMNADGSGDHQILTRARWPSFSPDGTRLAYYEMDTGLHLADAEGGNGKAIASGASCCYSWSPDAQWIAYNEPLNISQKQINGPIKKLKVDTAFNTTPQINSLGVKGIAPAFSPDGKQIAYGGCLESTSTCGIFVISAEGGVPRVVTSDVGGNPHWSPKGDKLVYHTQVDGRNQVFVVNADGSGKKQLTSGKGSDGQPVFSRDGTRIFYRSDQDGTEWALYVMNADGSSKKKLLSPAPADQDFWGWDSLSVGP